MALRLEANSIPKLLRFTANVPRQEIIALLTQKYVFMDNILDHVLVVSEEPLYLLYDLGCRLEKEYFA